MPVPGQDTYIVDDPISGAASTATDTLYLLSTAGPATPTPATRADLADATVNAQLRAYFADGGRSVVVQGYGDGEPLPTLEDALAALPAGPGQVVAPEAVLAVDLITIAEGAWAQGKVALLNGPRAATDAQLITLAGAVQAGTDARGAALFADYGLHAPLTGETPDAIPWSVTVAALIARNDRLTRNPNVAAAGKHGRSNALGLDNERTTAEITALKDAQINAAKDIYGQLRNYGFRTLADLDTVPHWWDLSGSRTVMALKARAASIDEEFVFEQIDGQGIVLGRFESYLRSALKDLYDLQALYGQSPDDAYRVVVDETVNPVEDLAAGELKAQVFLRVSPFAEHVVTNITRRAITGTV